MEIKKLEYTKDWTNPSDFPTYQDDETKVRADQQQLFNEVRDYVNDTLIPGVKEVDAKKVIKGVFFTGDRHLWVRYTDDTTEDIGILEVEAGEQGAPGEDGVGVSDFTYDAEQNLWVLTLTDNSTKNIAGPVIPKNLSELVDDTENRLVSDADIERWDAKMPVAGGTFTGAVYAKEATDATAQLRNTALVFTETTPTKEGQINWLCK